MHLIDTKVISELHKGGRANPGVTAFVSGLAPDDIYLSVQTIGEIRRGLESIRHRGDHEQADRLEDWREALLADYSDRILGFDLDCAQVWGRLMSPNPQHAIDKQIAAIALLWRDRVRSHCASPMTERSTGIRRRPVICIEIHMHLSP